MKIEVLGSGCPKCRKLEKIVREYVTENKLDADVTHVHDMDKILAYGVMMTPALVVDGAVKVSGKIPSSKELADALTL